MAKNNNTPVYYWLQLPLVELVEWIKDSNELINLEKRMLARRN